MLGVIFFLNIISENAITSRFFALLGIVTSIVAVSLLDKCDCVEKCMLVLNRYSFPIYLLHTIFTAGFRIVLLKVGGKQLFITCFTWNNSGDGNSNYWYECYKEL